jgi:hypothetical protein
MIADRTGYDTSRRRFGRSSAAGIAEMALQNKTANKTANKKQNWNIFLIVFLGASGNVAGFLPHPHF